MPSLTQKGQVTVPKPVRDLLGLETGDEVRFVVRGHRVEIERASTSHASSYGIVAVPGGLPVDPGDAQESLADALIEDDDRIRGRRK